MRGCFPVQIPNEKKDFIEPNKIVQRDYLKLYQLTRIWFYIPSGRMADPEFHDYLLSPLGRITETKETVQAGVTHAATLTIPKESLVKTQK